MKSNDTHINILCTYASCGKSKELTDKLVSMSRSGKANIMLDSGAFTAFNAKGDYGHITVEQYCNYLEKYGEEFEKYVMLDIIGNADGSRKNYEYMTARGLKPMFVATMFDNNYRYIADTLKVNENICVAGGVTTKSDWMTKRFQDIYNKTEGRAKIHGLGYVTFPKMLQLNLASVDSSSWKAAALRFGNLPYFDNGLKSVYTKDILNSGKLTNKKVIELLEMCKITPTIFADRNNHRGNFNIQILLSIFANIQMQRYCYKRGLRFFLAVNNVPDLLKIEYVSENIGNLDYKEFKNLCR